MSLSADKWFQNVGGNAVEIVGRKHAKEGPAVSTSPALLTMDSHFEPLPDFASLVDQGVSPRSS